MTNGELEPRPLWVARRPPASKRLLAQPQRLGVLPTWWFWNDKEVWKLARAPFVVVTLLAFFAVTLIEWSLPLWVTAAIPPLVLTLSLGLFERYLRRRARAAIGPDLVENKALVEPDDPRPSRSE